MEELYWITRFGHISNALTALVVISGLITTIMTIVWLVCASEIDIESEIYIENMNKRWAKIGKSFVTVCFPLFLICLIGNTFVPTTKEAYIIYGVGGTIDYIKSDEAAKQLPHKVIMAVDKYLESEETK